MKEKNSKYSLYAYVIQTNDLLYVDFRPNSLILLRLGHFTVEVTEMKVV